MDRDLWYTLWGVGLAFAIQLAYEGINEYPNLSRGFWFGLVINGFILAILMLSKLRKLTTDKKEEESEINEEQKEKKKDKGEPDTACLIAEYQVLNDSVNRRYRDMLLVESIMIPSTFVVVTFAIKYRNELGLNIFISGLPNAGFIPLISLLLLIFLWILRVTTNKINAISFKRQRDIEKELRIKGHQYIREQIECKTWFKIRWLMWHLIFVLLGGAYGFTAWWLFRETVIPPIP